MGSGLVIYFLFTFKLFLIKSELTAVITVSYVNSD